MKTWFVYSLIAGLIVSVLPISAGENSLLRNGEPQRVKVSSQRGGWEVLESGVTQDLNGIFFLCLNRGSVVGDESVILHISDGGDSTELRKIQDLWTASMTY
jgi:hypothetical protein